MNLENTCPQAVPDSTINQLRKHFVVNAERNLFLSACLLQLLNLLQDQDILAVPFKGPVLAESAYGDHALRHFVDLDVLIHKRDVPRALRLLESNGYRPDVELNSEQNKVYLETEYSFVATSNSGRVMVEIHWEMTGRYSSFPLDIEYLKDRLEPATLAGKKVFQPSPEDLLLYLCLHGAKHCWGELDWICSLAELVSSRPEIDWTRVTDLAKKMKCERITFLGLFLASDLLGAPLPVDIRKRAEADASIRKIASQVYQNLFHRNGDFSVNRMNPDFSSLHIKVRDKFLEKARYSLSLALKPTREDWRIFPLPAPLSFLHYLLRPMRLSVSAVSSFLRRYPKAAA